MDTILNVVSFLCSDEIFITVIFNFHILEMLFSFNDSLLNVLFTFYLSQTNVLKTKKQTGTKKDTRLVCVRTEVPQRGKRQTEIAFEVGTEKST